MSSALDYFVLLRLLLKSFLSDLTHYLGSILPGLVLALLIQDSFSALEVTALTKESEALPAEYSLAGNRRYLLQQVVHYHSWKCYNTQRIEMLFRSLPLFVQHADRKPCKYGQEYNDGGGGKLIGALLDKNSKHQDHAQDRQQNE